MKIVSYVMQIDCYTLDLRIFWATSAFKKMYPRG